MIPKKTYTHNIFQELPSPAELEEEVLTMWEKDDVFAASLAARKDAPTFVFYEGPPTANGLPHNGHVLTRVIKDLFPRYKTMRGFRAERIAGWDTHGLPVEIEVEKDLGMRSGGQYRNAREALLDYGLDNFAHKCVESVFKYTTEWEQLTHRVGFWVDLDKAYVTYHRQYIESVWWALATLFERGLLYQGYKSVWWWPEGGTALSAHEVGEGYRDVEDPAITVRFKLKNDPNTFLLAWTTTPWTLPSNTALAIGPDIDYAFVKTEDGQTLIAAASLKPEGEVLKTVKGTELVGLTYEPLYPFTTVNDRCYIVVSSDTVTTNTGTGVVHIAPGYGEIDFELGKTEGLALIQLVASDGHFAKDGVPDWLAGLYFKAADKPIVADLTARGLMFHRGTIRHSYPFSPRSKNDPLLQLARPGWFVRTTQFKEEVLSNNAAVNWLPEHIKEGRFGDFLRNNVDWALSRERFWGTPLPIWACTKCAKMEAFPSTVALQQRGAVGIDPTVNEHLQLHKPWVDRITVSCTCGETMNRVPEVIDCWFDSGCMPFAQFGFPHTGVEEFRNAFPADFISEAIDQTRGWFYSLMMISTMLFDETTSKHYSLNLGYPKPFKNCIVLGHVCDMEGKKESKSLGNYTSPNLVLLGSLKLKVVADPTLPRHTVGVVEATIKSIDLGKNEQMSLSCTETGQQIKITLKASPSQGKDTITLNPEDMAELDINNECWLHAPFPAPGADAFRWLFYANSPPGNNTRLSLKAIREGQREFHLRLANVFQFFIIYANIAKFDPSAYSYASTTILDRWIEEELNYMVMIVTKCLDEYNIFEATKAITIFVDNLSNWYVRRSRTQFWGDGDSTYAALNTLYLVLFTVSKLTAPFIPFMAEGMWVRLTRKSTSVHLQDWPTHKEPTPEGKQLSYNMTLIRECASLGLAARAAVGVRVRQPLRAVEVILTNPDLAPGIEDEEFLSLLRDELNVREVRLSTNASEFVDFKVKPNFKSLGARLGKEMKACAALITSADPLKVYQDTQRGGFTVLLSSGPISLTTEDIVVEFSPKPGFKAAGSARAVVVLHADLDDDLLEEGLSREVISRISAARKEHKLGYTDRIKASLHGDEAIIQAVNRFSGQIKHETLTIELNTGILTEDSTNKIDEHPYTLTIEKVTSNEDV